tara:strand:- start:800 stop:1429 length:630 start_codon:yes stop_codon:yes gene_type:complete
MNSKFPEKIPIFPLQGVIFFPETNLPLNIFENRYLEMVENSLNSNNLVGMIQSREINKEIFQVGCLGKIVRHNRTSDGRILIDLMGLTRFKIHEEIESKKLYREFKVNYDDFKEDLNPSNYKIDKDLIKKLINNSKKFFEKNNMIINWYELSKLRPFQQVYTLAMISPISITEKQKLLEIVDLSEIANTLNKIVEIGSYQNLNERNSIQ